MALCLKRTPYPWPYSIIERVAFPIMPSIIAPSGRHRFRRSFGYVLRAGLLASPLLLSAAPSHAATVTKTFTGFSDVFAPANWKGVSASDGSGSMNATTMTLKATDSTPSGTYQFTFDTALNEGALNAAAPGAGFTFSGGTYSFDWTWSFADGPVTKPKLGLIYPLTTFNGVNTPVQLWTYNGGDTSNAASYTTTGSSSALVSSGNTFGFRLASTITGDFFQDSVATITNFKFDAVYTDVPGPLPVAGAAAGFAWSRRLRRRLKQAAATSVSV